MGTRTFFNKLISSKKQLFIIDGLGALLTAFCLVAVLAPFEGTFGMPKRILYFLAVPACIFFLYSLCCYFFVTKNSGLYLKAIAIANLLYCLSTVVLVFIKYESLTKYGLAYFLLEVLVIILLVSVELRAVSGLQ